MENIYKPKDQKKTGEMVDKKNSGTMEKFFLILFFLAIIYFSYLVVRPFLLTVITAGILAYISYPLYRKVLKACFNQKYIAAFLTVLFVSVLVAAPLSILATIIWQEAVVGMQSLIEFGNEVVSHGGCEDSDSFSCMIIDYAVRLSQTEFFTRFLQDSVQQMSLLRSGPGIFFSVLGFIFHLFITMFSMFFFFVDGEYIVDCIKNMIPLTDKYRTMIIEKFKSITSGVIYGQIMTSIIQGLLAGIGFFVFDAASPVLFGLLTAFTSIFPFIGAVGVWLPIAVVKIGYSIASNDPTGIWMGVGLVIYGTFIVSMVDNFVRPKFIGDKARLHPILAFVGVLGGISLFGIVGLLLGPLIMALFVSTLDIYNTNLKEN